MGREGADTLWTTLASSVAFIGSSCLYRYIMKQRQIYLEYLIEEEERKQVMIWYRKRRWEDRMSFHNLSEGFRLQDSHDIYAASPELSQPDLEEFHRPQSSHWNHFEDSYLQRAKRTVSGELSNDKTDSVQEHPPRLLSMASLGGEDVIKSLESDLGADTDKLLEAPLIDTESVEGLFPSSVEPPSEFFLRSISLDDKSLWRRISSHPNLTALKDGVTANVLRKASSHPFSASTSTTDSSKSPSLSSRVRLQNRQARASYNARIMPDKLILIRHGQSMGNINEHLYATTPDNSMPLTKLGWEQAKSAGTVLRDKILKDPKSVHFIVSPYVRTVETFHGILSAWCDPAEFKHISNRDERLRAWYCKLHKMGLSWHEDPRIREQDFGNYQEPEKIKKAKKDRHRFGAFYYRFPHGESASDVYDRISTFLDSLWRSFDMNKCKNYVIITHGISIRVLLARYFRYTIDQFNLLANPRNCEMVILGHDGMGRLRLKGRCEIECEEDEESGEKHVVGYKCHGRLRILPDQWVRKVKIRMSYDD